MAYGHLFGKSWLLKCTIWWISEQILFRVRFGKKGDLWFESENEKWFFTSFFFGRRARVHFLKRAILGLFLYFRLFNTVVSEQMFNINFADDWIQTVDLWYRKRLLYQLSHNHCQSSFFCVNIGWHFVAHFGCLGMTRDFILQ